jgi:hypothetical protein
MIKEEMVEEYTPMSIDDIKNYVVQQYEQAWLGTSEIRKERQDNLEYYENRSTKDQPAGNRSAAQTSDIADNVNWLLDETMDLLYSVASPVEFVPLNAQDIPAAKAETACVTYVLNQENEGFLISYQWIKDALIQKNGILKVFWDKQVREELETYEGLTHQEFLMLFDDPDVTVEAQTFYIDGQEQESNIVPPIDDRIAPEIKAMQLQNRLQSFTHDVKLRRKSEVGKITLENVAPENFFVNRNHNSLDLAEALFCAQRERKTRGSLIDDGYDAAVVMDLPIYSDIISNEEASIRYAKEGANFINTNVSGDNKLAEEVEVWEAYCYCDLLGDGKLKLVQSIMAGGKNGEMLHYEEVDSVPFIALTPEINSYRFFGTCPADRVKQIQRVKTAVTRQMMDNLYAHNNPQPVVNIARLADEGIEDIKNTDIGALIRVTQDGAIVWHQTPFMAADSLPILQLFDDMAERRTGVSKMSQGLDASLLKDQSMFIGAKMLNQSQKKVLFLARTFAETGFRWLYLKIHELMLKHESNEKMVEINGNYQSINPRAWRKRTSMRVMVGTGNNTNEVKLAGLTQISALQEKLIAGGGMGLLVAPDKIYNTLSDMVELMGLKDANRYFMNPAQAQPQPEKPKEPEPAFILGMADIQAKKEIAAANNEIKIMELTAKTETERTKLAQDAILEKEKIALQRKRVDG